MGGRREDGTYIVMHTSGPMRLGEMTDILPFKGLNENLPTEDSAIALKPFEVERYCFASRTGWI